MCHGRHSSAELLMQNIDNRRSLHNVLGRPTTAQLSGRSMMYHKQLMRWFTVSFQSDAFIYVERDLHINLDLIA
jgi:hypothetical protein